MPYKNKADRDYKNEYETYQGKPDQIKKRAKRNAARRAMAKAGKVSKGDGKDVDHVVPLSKGGSNTRSNLRAVSKSANRSFKRKSDKSVK
jgi:5-methylcytosine-specific restriction endonuclease McrA